MMRIGICLFLLQVSTGCISSYTAVKQEKNADPAFVANLFTSQGPTVDRRWPDPSHIPVCWDGLAYPVTQDYEVIPGVRIPEYKKIIQEVVVREYKKAGINFIGWGDCEPSGNGVRIVLTQYRPEAPVGYHAFTTLLLPVYSDIYDEEKKYFRRTALHEFGHVLGFLHEDDRRDSIEECKKNDTAAEFMTENPTQIGEYDPSSIMSYCFLEKHPYVIQHGKPTTHPLLSSKNQ